MTYLEIISRPKLNGPGRHFGVLLSSGICFDFLPTGIRKTTELDFANGHQIKREEKIFETKAAIKRLIEIVEKEVKYDLINFNCENFARYLATGKSESKQISFFLVLTILFGGIYFLNEA